MNCKLANYSHLKDLFFLLLAKTYLLEDSMELESIDIDLTKLSTEIVKASKAELSEEDLISKIAVAAYYKAESRGYEPGHEIQDWMEAESEILYKK